VAIEQNICTVRVPEGYVVGGWRVRHALASGSWSSVYAAARAGVGEPREAALKFIPTGTLTARQLTHLADMADREVAVHRYVDHPGLIRVLDIIVIDDPGDPALDGVTVLALELAAESAATALQRADGAGLSDAPRIIADVCGALAHLHRAGWVHGDLKPGNILLMPDGTTRLADFGLSAHIDGTHAYLPPGGTSDYVPPERWAEPVQRRGTAVRQTADIWAVGVTVCQLLTGQLPFPASPPGGAPRLPPPMRPATRSSTSRTGSASRGGDSSPTAWRPITPRGSGTTPRPCTGAPWRTSPPPVRSGVSETGGATGSPSPASWAWRAPWSRSYGPCREIPRRRRSTTTISAPMPAYRPPTMT
jgi:serine/threonine protein kinase